MHNDIVWQHSLLKACFHEEFNLFIDITRPIEALTNCFPFMPMKFTRIEPC